MSDGAYLQVPLQPSASSASTKSHRPPQYNPSKDRFEVHERCQKAPTCRRFPSSACTPRSSRNDTNASCSSWSSSWYTCGSFKVKAVEGNYYWVISGCGARMTQHLSPQDSGFLNPRTGPAFCRHSLNLRTPCTLWRRSPPCPPAPANQPGLNYTCCYCAAKLVKLFNACCSYSHPLGGSCCKNKNKTISSCPNFLQALASSASTGR